MTIRYDLIHGSPEWHAERSKGCGASEVAGLFREETRSYGLSEFMLYQIKSGAMPEPFEENERTILGRLLEPGIISAAAVREGWSVRTGGYAVADDCDWIRASLDGEADRIPARLVSRPEWEMVSGPGVVEAKNVSRETVRNDFGWDPKNPDRPTPPRRMTLQLQHGMLAAGHAWGVLCCLFEGDNLQTYYYRANPRTHAAIRSRVARLYASIAFRRPPPCDGNVSTERAIKEHYRNTTGRHLVVPETHKSAFDDACAEREVAEAQRRYWDNKAHENDNIVRQILGHYETAQGQDWYASLKADKNGNRRRMNVRQQERKP